MNAFAVVANETIATHVGGGRRQSSSRMTSKAKGMITAILIRAAPSSPRFWPEVAVACSAYHSPASFRGNVASPRISPRNSSRALISEPSPACQLSTQLIDRQISVAEIETIQRRMMKLPIAGVVIGSSKRRHVHVRRRLPAQAPVERLSVRFNDTDPGSLPLHAERGICRCGQGRFR